VLPAPALSADVPAQVTAPVQAGHPCGELGLL
jgi:hypothetical protein